MKGDFDNTSETEKAVLSSILEGQVSFEDVKAVLEPNDFYTETNRLIFKAMESLTRQCEPIGFITLGDELNKVPMPNGGVWISYLTNLSLTALPIVNKTHLNFHLAKMKRDSQSRKLYENSLKLIRAIKDRDDEKIELLVEQISKFQDIDIGILNRLRPISAKDLPDMPPPEALWAGLIYPSCITQLNAEPGAGKSTILYNIAGLGAQNKPFLGISFPKPIKTLYIDFETPQWLQRQKIESICGELPADFHLISDLNLGTDLRDLIRLCKSDEYDLIVFDTQSRILAMEDENDNSQANRAADLLCKLTKYTGVAVLLIHHTRKGDSGKQGVYRGRGASAIAAAVDIVANLEVLDTDTLKLKVEKSRLPGAYQSITMKKLGGDKFERVSTEENNVGPEIRRIQDFLLELLGDGRVWRTSELLKRSEHEGFKERTFRDALKRLCDAGKVTRLGQGRYILKGGMLDGSPDTGDYEENFGIPEAFL